MVLQGFGCLKPETGPESRSELTLAGLRDFPQPLAERLRAQAAGRPGWRPGVAIPGRIRRSLRAIKSANEPVVAGLAGMVHWQEQPAATRQAGMDPAEICIDKERICSHM